MHISSSILEFKSFFFKSFGVYMCILVAPYWNLNFSYIFSILRILKHISSSILEFKLKFKNISEKIAFNILVAPYWNLNDLEC